ncbi:MAG: hypothetical protein A2374_02015 [Candidatus Moranbacteria bacterium RIFOXYB1_FULL_44_23]|nr:MAG: hypothetical protein A2194_03660 [Candidatus Moranbacteria bacterium RIFOXYA1_FULL_44_8]OGI40786.1 MAG: hypothetical protein A2374_02015 [Candidatus Moranbacteria bacterium RIFOXYB1_FULL_44_23]HBB36983.1 hypothetical protein [Candidatus Moranbacteria bacterium]HBU25004.1 hypothetical protein [Candidatus Moranbacteria bacterium]
MKDSGSSSAHDFDKNFEKTEWNMLKKGFLTIFLAAAFLAVAMPSQARSLSKAILVITCDDGHWTQWEYLAPIMRNHGIVGTCYPVTSWIRNDYDFMYVSDLQTLKGRGWEMGNHTQNHTDALAVADQTFLADLEAAKQDLVGWGLGPVSAFAPPYGEFNSHTVELIKPRGYTSLRRACGEYNDTNYVSNFDAFGIEVISLKAATDMAKVKTWLNDLVDQKAAGVLVVHQVNVAGDPDSITSAMAEEILGHAAGLIAEGQLETLTVSQMVKKMRPADISAVISLLLLDE